MTSYDECVTMLFGRVHTEGCGFSASASFISDQDRTVCRVHTSNKIHDYPCDGPMHAFNGLDVYVGKRIYDVYRHANGKTFHGDRFTSEKEIPVLHDTGNTVCSPHFTTELNCVVLDDSGKPVTIERTGGTAIYVYPVVIQMRLNYELWVHYCIKEYENTPLSKKRILLGNSMYHIFQVKNDYILSYDKELPLCQS